MKFYVKQHKYYCGIDLHARTMYVCIIDKEGAIVKQKNIFICGVPPPHGGILFAHAQKVSKNAFPP